MADEEEREPIVVDPVHYLVPDLQPGDRCCIQPGDRSGKVMFVGPVAGMPGGYWVGVQYDDKVGKNDGCFTNQAGEKRRFFTCPPGHGGFLRATKVTTLVKKKQEMVVKEEEVKTKGAKDKGGKDKGGKESPTPAADATAKGDKTAKDKDHPVKEEAPPPPPPPLPPPPPAPVVSLPVSAMTSGGPSKAGTERGRSARGRSDRSRSPARARDPHETNPEYCIVSGSGLVTCVVGMLAQFMITAFNGTNTRREEGGDNFQVIMRGEAGKTQSQPALQRCKITDRSDGSYMVEYRPYMTGTYSIDVRLEDEPIKGSPFFVTVITLRPEASHCQVRGSALHSAVARTSVKFEVHFADAMGSPAHAEDLDVWVEPMGWTPEMPVTDRLGGGEAAAAAAAVAASKAASKAPSPGEKEGSIAAVPGGRVSPASPPAGRPASPTAKGADAASAAPTGRASPTGAPPAKGAGSAPPTEEGVESTEAMQEVPYRKLDAPLRQRHLQLWATRQAADKWLARRAAESAFRSSGFGSGDGGGEGGKKKMIKIEQVMPSFAHELAGDQNKHGFAFGGVDPGTLHAHGKLVKVHHVSYSVGLAGKYWLHVGLRNQGCPLPGSPFSLTVIPGAAYAASTRLPPESLNLKGSADEAWQVGTILRTADMLGNTCIQGGANITLTLSKRFMLQAHGGAPQEEETRRKDALAGGAPVLCRVTDNQDGSYALDWKSQLAGSFPLDVMVDGSHVSGSPITVNVRAAKPDVNRFVASGAGLSKAVAGVEAPIRIRVADRFDNSAEVGPNAGTTTFGLYLTSLAGGGGGAGSKKHAKDGNTKEAKPAAAKDAAKPEAPVKGGKANFAALDGGGRGVRKTMSDSMESIPFEGAWVGGGSYELRYMPQIAGPQELHVWCEVGQAEGREPLPGSPFSVHVSEGGPSPVGSYVREAEASKQGGGIVAGEHVILRPMVHDQFGNATAAPEGSLTAVLDSPGNHGEKLDPPKLRSGLGTYELILEPLKSGDHLVHILLYGVEITGSPVSFKVLAAQPNAPKCYLSRPPDAEPTLINQMCDVKLTTHDKYGNQLERGGVRVDAKAAGIAVSTCTVVDHKNGTYTISLTAGAPGEVKVTCRVDSVDIKTLSVFFVREKEVAAEGKDEGKAEEAAGGEGGGGGEEAEAAASAEGGDKKKEKKKKEKDAPASAAPPPAATPPADAADVEAGKKKKATGAKKAEEVPAVPAVGKVDDDESESASGTPKKGKKGKKGKKA